MFCVVSVCMLLFYFKKFLFQDNQIYIEKSWQNKNDSLKDKKKIFFLIGFIVSCYSKE